MGIEERTTRILTTHAGSLPRTDDVSAPLFAKMTGRPYDPAALAAAIRAAVAAIVKRQVDLEIDIVSDGEQSKPSFQIYVVERLSGLEPIKSQTSHRRTRENAAFPSFYKMGRIPAPSRRHSRALDRSPTSATRSSRMISTISKLRWAASARPMYLYPPCRPQAAPG